VNGAKFDMLPARMPAGQGAAEAAIAAMLQLPLDPAARASLDFPTK